MGTLRATRGDFQEEKRDVDPVTTKCPVTAEMPTSRSIYLILSKNGVKHSSCQLSVTPRFSDVSDHFFWQLEYRVNRTRFHSLVHFSLVLELESSKIHWSRFDSEYRRQTGQVHHSQWVVACFNARHRSSNRVKFTPRVKFLHFIPMEWIIYSLDFFFFFLESTWLLYGMAKWIDDHGSDDITSV